MSGTSKSIEFEAVSKWVGLDRTQPTCVVGMDYMIGLVKKNEIEYSLSLSVMRV